MQACSCKHKIDYARARFTLAFEQRKICMYEQDHQPPFTSKRTLQTIQPTANTGNIVQEIQDPSSRIVGSMRNLRRHVGRLARYLFRSTWSDGMLTKMLRTMKTAHDVAASCIPPAYHTPKGTIVNVTQLSKSVSETHTSRGIIGSK